MPAACYVVLSLPLCLAKCIHVYIIEEYSAILTSRKSLFHKRYNEQLISNWKNHPEHNFHWHIRKQFNDCPKLCSITDLWASFKHPSPHKHSETFHGKLCDGISFGVGGQLTPEIYSNESHELFYCRLLPTQSTLVYVRLSEANYKFYMYGVDASSQRLVVQV